MLVEKRGYLAKRLARFRNGVIAAILRMALAFIDIEVGLDPGAAQLAMGAHRVRQQQIARAAGEDGGRKAVHVAIDGRDQLVLEVMAMGIDDGGGVAEAVARD